MSYWKISQKTANSSYHDVETKKVRLNADRNMSRYTNGSVFEQNEKCEPKTAHGRFHFSEKV